MNLKNKKPRVALVHSYYSSKNPSGENLMVNQQAEAMRRDGYDVRIFRQDTDVRERRPSYLLETAFTVATGHGPSPEFKDFKPDLIHVHNLFPNFGKKWVQEAGLPIVSTLHNYRPLCIAGTLYRAGRVCTDCLDVGNSWPGVKHGCYRNVAASLPAAIGNKLDSDEVLLHSDALIALSNSMKDIYVQAGVRQEKFRVLPNFLPNPLDVGIGPGGEDWLYVGRLSAEKGILPLVRSWPSTARKLIVVGDGELLDEIVLAAKSNVLVLGKRSRSEVLDLMSTSLGLVFPSQWLEGFGLTYMEAISTGTPVLAWNPSVVADFVSNDGTGIVVGPDLEMALGNADHSFPQLRDHCRGIFERRYTEQAWMAELASIYDSIL